MGVGRGGNGRWALAALLGCVALLVGAPAALAATSQISGTVTDVSLKPLENIEVTAYEVSGKESFVGFATTNAKGEYTVTSLPEGSYEVEFSAGGGQNYVTQYYKGKSSFTTAEPVPVLEGKTTEKINAELVEGGKVEGTVTDASTHAAVSNVIVEVLGEGEAQGGFAITNASGQYTIVGLATGSYRIVFARSGYIAQYYNNQPSFTSANLVGVVQKSTTLGINAALVPAIAPVNTTAPVASGTPAVGQTLSCTTGSWRGSPAPTFTYSWLRDGVPISGATGSTYVVQAADLGNGLTCKVAAKNKIGSAAAVSNTLIVPVPPPPPPPPPVVALLSSRIVMSGRSAPVPIACANATCAGTIELTERVVFKPRHGSSKKKTLVQGRSSYALAAGHNATILVRLTGAAKNALARAKHHRLSARISVSVIGGTTVQQPVVLSEAVTKHKGKHK